MARDREIRNRILETAQERFLRFGFVKVTMDELAYEMGMSKKTLYQHFSSKEQLLREIIKLVHKEIETATDRILHDNDLHFVDKLRHLMAFLAMQLSRMGQPLLQDLQRSAPDVWKQIDEWRQKRILANFGNLLNEGMRKGAFKRDVDQQLVVLIYSTLIQRIINPEILSQLPLSAAQAFETIIKVIFEGILTDEARAEYRARQPLSNRKEEHVL
jgi:AcrR family transcriptional regulator